VASHDPGDLLYNGSVNEATRSLRRIAIGTYIVLLHIAAVYFAYQHFRPVFRDPIWAVPPIASNATPPVPELVIPPPQPMFTSTPVLPSSGLLIPVAGVAPEDLINSFSDVRGEGRTHQAIDIPAPEGTPVLAAADGEIARFFDSESGGITIYQWSSGRDFVFYYAHLKERAQGLSPGDRVRTGQIIGYVGDTGNAGAGNFHLHFSVSKVRDPERFWESEPLDPFPFLRDRIPFPPPP
jgi:peptidoglycan LD-endopeptidase LytH